MLIHCFFSDGDKDVLHALKMLVALYLPKAKKIEDTLIHLYEEYEVCSFNQPTFLVIPVNPLQTIALSMIQKWPKEACRKY